jgi:hypothetical protein
MKALSIRQPYAFAIVMGFKPVENRDWPTRYRGGVLIHAGKKEETDDVEGVLRQIAHETGVALPVIQKGYTSHRSLGTIVGAATLTDCVTAMASEWFYGPYGFVMKDAKWCAPVACKGALSFFEVPLDVICDIHCPPCVELSMSH